MANVNKWVKRKEGGAETRLTRDAIQLTHPPWRVADDNTPLCINDCRWHPQATSGVCTGAML